LYFSGRKIKMKLDVPKMSPAERIKESITRSLPLMAPEMASQVKKLLTPEAIAVIAGILTAWAVASLFGVGEIAGVILLVLGAVALGGAAWDAGKHLMVFTDKTLNAKTENDFTIAAQNFSAAVVIIGVNGVIAFLFKQRPPVFKKNFMMPGKPFWKLKEFGQGPRNAPGSYKPGVTRTRQLVQVAAVHLYGEILRYRLGER
jgi:hypothetical protein